MAEVVSKRLAKEVTEISENLKEPVCDLVASSVAASIDTLATVTSGVARILGSLLEEGARVTERVRRGLEAAAE